MLPYDKLFFPCLMTMYCVIPTGGYNTTRFLQSLFSPLFRSKIKILQVLVYFDERPSCVFLSSKVPVHHPFN